MERQELREIISELSIGRASVMTETIVVEGETHKGARFTMPVRIMYNPKLTSVEEALIATFGSQAKSFSELCIEQRWRSASWTYPGSYHTARAVI